jgi:hypothetical protein
MLLTIVDSKPCKCGCGLMAGPGKMFIKGHHFRLLNAERVGTKQAEKTKIKRSKTLTSIYLDPNLRKEQSERQKIVWANKPVEEKSKGAKKFWFNLKQDFNCLKKRNENLSRGMKKRWASLLPEVKNRILSRWFECSDRKPNETENYVTSLIQKSRPTDFIYSGDGVIWIAGKNPDWFNINGKKQVIEFLGTYWHGEKLTGRIKEQEEEYLINHYKRYDYSCLIIWESELKNPDKIIDKIRFF